MSTTKINRNAPCTCGSGKKYKKCCGLKEAVSFTAIIEKEMLQLQGEIINYAEDYYRKEIEKDFDLLREELDIQSEDESEFFAFVHTVWYILFKPLSNGETILQKFIHERLKKIQRPKLQEVLQTWTNAMPVAGRVISLTSGELVLHDTLRNEEIKVKLLQESAESDAKFGFGITVPFGEDRIFFPFFFDLIGNEIDAYERNLHDDYEDSDYQDPTEFLKNEFVLSMNFMQFSIEDLDAEAFEWENPTYKEVAELFIDGMEETAVDSSLIVTGVVLWKGFCKESPKRINKPALYAAALEYLMLTLPVYTELTKKQVAEKYGVSVSGMSKVLNHLEEVLYDHIHELRESIAKEMFERLEAYVKEHGSDGLDDH